MLPFIWAALRTYAPIIVLPAAAAVGLIGYVLESTFRDKYTPHTTKSIEQERDARQLNEMSKDSSELPDHLKERKFVPKTIFEKNLSPQLVNPKPNKNGQ